jgi:hypothetical protein
MVVHVGFLSVLGLFLVLRIVVAVDEGVVVMLVRVGSGGMSALGLPALALGGLVPFAW